MLGCESADRADVGDLVHSGVRRAEPVNAMAEFSPEPRRQRNREALFRMVQDRRWNEARDGLSKDPLSNAAADLQIARQRQGELDDLVVEQRDASFEGH